MAQGGLEKLLKFYRKIITNEFIECLVEGAGLAVRDGVYRHAVVMWLMILQRLSDTGTLTEAVEALRAGSCENLLSVRGRKCVTDLSGATGGYARARSRLPLVMVSAVADRINAAITGTHQEACCKGYKLFALDGTSVRLEHTAENLKDYPQCSTDKTQAHYPLARVVVATDVLTRVTLRPMSGPLHGPSAKWELELAQDILPLIPQDAVVMADRFYGSFHFCYQVFCGGKQVLMRLSEKRANRFIGQLLEKPDSGKVAVRWTPSKLEANKYVDLPADAAVPGYCVWQTIRRNGFRPVRMIIFTTLDLSVEDAVEMYMLRWNVEDTIRDIKITINMDFIHAKTPDMVHKELTLGVVAYNLVRHFMAGFAGAHKVALERLSFTSVLRRIRVFAPIFLDPLRPTDVDRRFERAFLDPRGLLLPNRSRPRQPEPRKRWPRGDKRVFMQHSRQHEREKLATPPFRTTYEFK
jgi:putative transposase